MRTLEKLALPNILGLINNSFWPTINIWHSGWIYSHSSQCRSSKFNEPAGEVPWALRSHQGCTENEDSGQVWGIKEFLNTAFQWVMFHCPLLSEVISALSNGTGWTRNHGQQRGVQLKSSQIYLPLLRSYLYPFSNKENYMRPLQCPQPVSSSLTK